MNWQNDANSIDQNIRNVQFWRNGIMVTAQMSPDTARELVQNGEAFIISAQSVGAIINGERAS